MIGGGDIAVKTITCILQRPKVIQLQHNTHIYCINLYHISLQLSQVIVYLCNILTSQNRNICNFVLPFFFVHLGVHVGAIQVHLASVLVNEITYVSDLLLKHAKGGRVGDHHGCQTRLVFIHLKEGKIQETTSLLLKLHYGVLGIYTQI